jgi:hypothetical protein
VSDQIASWDTTSEMGTKALLLHPFQPLICVADDKETIRYLTPSFIVDGECMSIGEVLLEKACLILYVSILAVASSFPCSFCTVQTVIHTVF